MVYNGIRTGGDKQVKKNIEFEVDENNCFICTSHYVNRYGYPLMKYLGDNGKRTSKSIARFIYIEMFGNIPDNLVIRHKCDNRKCINPNHLEVETPAENSKDMIERKRSLKGSDHPKAKLNEWDVRRIKKMLEIGYSTTLIGNLFNVNSAVIYKIKNNINWTHVNEKLEEIK